MSETLKPIELAIKRVKKLIKTQEDPLKIIAITGSGISKGSGIPTFRGKDGLWKNYNAMELATPQAFSRDPKLVWEWYSWRMGIILDKEPNAAHYSIIELQEKGLLTEIITQNVDSLHYRAGSRNLTEIHGNIFRAKCVSCNFKTIQKTPPKEPPKCPKCNNLLRPDVVWFGESLNTEQIRKSYALLTNECDVVLVIGTSGVVYPVAEFPQIAKSNGSIIIEFNVEPTPISRITDFTILGKSELTLPKFVDGILKN